MKKILALVLVALMAATMIPAMADFGYDTSVSVTDLQAGDTVKYYQILDWDQANGTWKLAAGFTGLAGNTNFASDVVTDIINGLTQAQADAIAALAANATAKYTDSNISGTTSTYTLPATDDAAKLAAVGLYMGVITAGNPSTIYNPVFVGADFDDSVATPSISVTATYGNDGIAKKQTITLTKTTSDADSAVDEAIDSYVGQEVTFYVDTQIPVFLASYQNPTFNIVDTIGTNGIEMKPGTIEITLGTGDSATTYAKSASTGKVAYDDTKFSVTENADKKTYTVDFTDSYLLGNATAVPVHIEYKGVITNAATFNVNEDENTVTVTYSNGPGEETAALRDRTNHYTFSIGAEIFGAGDEHGKTYELVKVGVDEEGNPVVEKQNVSEWSTQEQRHPLAGATFGLYTAATCADSEKYVNALYPDGATYTTVADGVITFKGLAAGTYYLKEISAPSGYVKDNRVTSITITPTYEQVTVADTIENGIKVKGYTVDVLKSYTVTVNNVSVYDETISTAHPDGFYGQASGNIVSTYTYDNDGPSIDQGESFTVNDSDLINTKGVELPSTGGMGTTLLYVGGSILVLAAVILLVTKRRMGAND